MKTRPFQEEQKKYGNQSTRSNLMAEKVSKKIIKRLYKKYNVRTKGFFFFFFFYTVNHIEVSSHWICFDVIQGSNKYSGKHINVKMTNDKNTNGTAGKIKPFQRKKKYRNRNTCSKVMVERPTEYV